MTQTDLLSSRLLCLVLLEQILKKGQNLEDAYDRLMKDASMEKRDRAHVRLLVTLTLRRLGQIDRIIGQCLKKPLPEKAFAVQNVLRLGICQLLFLKTPPHAAVHTSVELARRRGFSSHADLVNAVLQRINRNPEEFSGGEADNMPPWLFMLLSEDYGVDQAKKIACAHLSEPPLDVFVPEPENVSVWAEKLSGVSIGGGTVRIENSGPVSALPGYDEGKWWVQDYAASRPVFLFPSLSGTEAADLCAAPGGKTAQMKALGASVTAFDVSEKRNARLKENMNRLHFPVRILTVDVQKQDLIAPFKQSFDRILLDAPCSATGTLRRHPDMAWHKGNYDVERLAEVQKKLLSSAGFMLKPGGYLVYCVCSLLKREGEFQIDEFLRENKSFSRTPVPPSDNIPDFCRTDKGDISTFPFYLEEKGGMDGFFASLLRKEG